MMPEDFSFEEYEFWIDNQKEIKEDGDGTKFN